jgi:HSP20 family protein
MSDLKKWYPFRFPRRRGNAEMPARSAATGPLNMATMRDEMDRMFEQLWSNPMAVFETQDRWFGDFSRDGFQPRLDVTDEKNFLRVTLEVPGVDMKDIDVDVQDGVMTITGEKKHEETSEEEGCYRTERSHGSFRRSIPLPAEVEAGKADAKLDKGVLTIKVPKSERARQSVTKVLVKA